jgi:hypothetical protein
VDGAPFDPTAEETTNSPLWRARSYFVKLVVS